MNGLIVIDVQKSYMTKYETDLLERMNRQIDIAKKNQYDIVYIKNTKMLRRGAVTDEFADELNIVSDNVFYKEKSDAFSSEQLISYLNSRNISTVELIGVDGNSCIKASAKGAVKNGFKVSIALNCAGITNPELFDKTKEQLKKIGVRFI